MPLDPTLLEILVCPGDHADLRYDAAAGTLTCTGCGRIYEIRDDVPVMLLDEARLPESSDPGAAQ
jgi:uncharacterized protein YbaR (Trm112 family)